MLNLLVDTPSIGMANLALSVNVIAPIFEAGAVSRSVYLPAGTAWIDCASRVRYEGGQTVTVEAPMDVIPVFAKEGASVLELM